MSVRDRIEDSKLQFHGGRLEGALISVLLAVAATSRKRYPKNTTRLGDREAFVQFLIDERKKITGDQEVTIEFRGDTLGLETFLYKFVRNCLIHEAELDDSVSFEYGDFLLDKRGTTDYFTFSSELILRLCFIVETAPENQGSFPDGRYDRLPEPCDLKQVAIVKYEWGDQHFEIFCSACSIRTEEWEDTGELVTWLHIKGHQAFRGQIADRPGVRMLVPTRYVTSMTPGPNFQRARKRTGIDVGLFAPDKPPAEGAMNLAAIKEALAAMQIPMVETTIRLYRPHYEVGDGNETPPAP